VAETCRQPNKTDTKTCVLTYLPLLIYRMHGATIKIEGLDLIIYLFIGVKIHVHT